MKKESEFFEYKLTILEHHLDTFGHVNNATYVAMFEEARWDLITNRGYGIKEVQERRKGPVISGLSVQFLRELKVRETITIRTQAKDYDGKFGKIYQSMINEKGKTACTAEFTWCFFDLESRRRIEAIPEWIEAVGLT